MVPHVLEKVSLHTLSILCVFCELLIHEPEHPSSSFVWVLSGEHFYLGVATIHVSLFYNFSFLSVCTGNV